MPARHALLTVLFLAAVAVGETKVPRATVAPAGDIEVILPASVLRQNEVRKQLASGLTTAFIATFEERERGGKSLRGAARIEVRYDLWDEIYLVATLEADGRRQKLTLPSYERLVEWWSRAPLRLARSSSAADAPQNLRLKVEVLPFSATEEADAQRWLSRAVGTGGSSASAGQRPDSAALGLLDVIIGTAVQRRPILDFRWTVRTGVQGRR